MYLKDIGFRKSEFAGKNQFLSFRKIMIKTKMKNTELKFPLQHKKEE